MEKSLLDSINSMPGLKRLASGGMFRVFEHEKDSSVAHVGESIQRFFMEKQGVKRRQLVAELDGSKGVVLSAGAMQLMHGRLQMQTNVKGAGDFLKKAFSAKVTGESAVKPYVTGRGVLVCEPTFNHMAVIDIGATDGLVINDGIFEACESTVELKIVVTQSLSGALLSKEGLFNLGLFGEGFAVIELPIPFTELIKVPVTKGERFCVDGSYAVMWESSVSLSVEKTSKTFVGSVATGEGLMNVFTGEGSVWIHLTQGVRSISAFAHPVS